MLLINDRSKLLRKFSGQWTGNFFKFKIQEVIYTKIQQNAKIEKYLHFDINPDLVDLVHYALKQQDILIERFDRSLDDVVRFLSVALKEQEDLIYSFKDLDIFEVHQSNRAVRQRLTKKCILKKHSILKGYRKKVFT